MHKIGSIGANAEFKYVLDMTATKIGTYSVVVGLSSNKVEHVSGEKEVRDAGREGRKEIEGERDG